MVAGQGNLPAALLAAAERTLRERGVEQVSLRDLARQVEVSHGAPSRHFRDRQDLLDALAAEGFVRLGDEIAAGIENAGDDFEAQLRAVAAAYVRFAVEDAALLELMLAVKKDDGPDAGPKAPERPYALLTELIQHGQETGKLHPRHLPGHRRACHLPQSPGRADRRARHRRGRTLHPQQACQLNGSGALQVVTVR
jgi:AcrR family transcriptional regulator